MFKLGSLKPCHTSLFDNDICAKCENHIELGEDLHVNFLWFYFVIVRSKKSCVLACKHCDKSNYLQWSAGTGSQPLCEEDLRKNHLKGKPLGLCKTAKEFPEDCLFHLEVLVFTQNKPKILKLLKLFMFSLIK